MRIEPILAAVSGTVTGSLTVEEFTGISSLNGATDTSLTFIVKQSYIESAAQSKAAAVFVREGWEIPGKATITVADPYLAYAQTALLFEDKSPLFGSEIAQSAAIDSSAQIAKGVVIGPNCSIGADVILGKNCKIDANVVIERGVTLGENCYVHSGAVIRYNVKCGNDVIISSNAVIGSEGFANAFHKGQFTRIPCFGTVNIEDRVEIGACTTIDRGNFENTIIKAGTRIDNLVQIAHNVVVGESCGIAAQAGFAGSTTIGNRVMVAGQVGMAGHLTIGDDVFIGAQAGVPSDLAGGDAYAGSPCMRMKEQRRVEIAQQKLPELLREFRTMKKEIEALKEEIKNGKTENR